MKVLKLNDGGEIVVATGEEVTNLADDRDSIMLAVKSPYDEGTQVCLTRTGAENLRDALTELLTITAPPMIKDNR